MPRLPYRTWVEVSLSQIVENYRLVCESVGPGVQVMGVVKSDAYGHGAPEVARQLEAQGIQWLAVSNVDEGIGLRQAGIRTRLLVMADALLHDREALSQHDLTPVIHSLEDLVSLDEFGHSRSLRLRYHLKLDTGMGRLGTAAPAGEILEVVRSCRHAEMDGLMTHFASSADYGSQHTERQLAAFEETLAALQSAGVTPAWIHMSSTNPIAYGRRRAWGNLVRAGHILYGYISPAKGDAPAPLLQVRPALAWRAAILATKELPVGALVGYGGTFRAERPTRIAVLAAGYADGVPHRMSNRGKVIAGGQLVPVIGAVSMDLTTIDITDAPPLRPGDAVTLLGREGNAELNAQQVARWAGTISYSVLCGINPRVPRVYV
ncbi:MAG TPA: alanine racemase [Bryobacteraceae bacterium]|nr:alanine racemase [Bryobacteraceae bacterium]